MELSFFSCLLVMNKLFFFCELPVPSFVIWFEILALMDSSPKALSQACSAATISPSPCPAQSSTAA